MKIHSRQSVLFCSELLLFHIADKLSVLKSNDPNNVWADGLKSKSIPLVNFHFISYSSFITALMKLLWLEIYGYCIPGSSKGPDLSIPLVIRVAPLNFFAKVTQDGFTEMSHLFQARGKLVPNYVLSLCLGWWIIF